MQHSQLWVSALTLASFYSLLGLAYYIVHAGAGFFNIAIGAYASLAGLSTSWLVIQKDVSIWLAFGCAMVGVTLVAAATELFVVRTVQRRGRGSELAALVAVTAVLFLLSQAAGYMFGYTPLPGQQLLKIDPIFIGDAVLTPNTLIMIVAAVVLFGVIAVLIRTTSHGRVLRAVGDNKEVANLLGLPVGSVRVVAFMLCGLLAGLGGVLFSSQAGVSSASGLGWAISGFLAVVIGGTGSIAGPIFGGLTLGTLEIFVPFYFGGNTINIVLLFVVAFFFAFRPEGMFAQRVRI